MRFYIATGLGNAALGIRLANVLIDHGHDLTYDWTEHGDVRYDGQARMSAVAFNEFRAVRDAELVIALLPGGSSTHTEIGAAIATRGNKRIILWSINGDEFMPDSRTCVFYFHPSVERIVCPVEVLLDLFDVDALDSAIDEFKV
ncbi:MAG: hypothetical protein IKS90_04505 [Clostridia bacterium]|nr:hypothetical protein [Clostridia bacterium]